MSSEAAWKDRALRAERERDEAKAGEPVGAIPTRVWFTVDREWLIPHFSFPRSVRAEEAIAIARKMFVALGRNLELSTKCALHVEEGGIEAIAEIAARWAHTDKAFGATIDQAHCHSIGTAVLDLIARAQASEALVRELVEGLKEAMNLIVALKEHRARFLLEALILRAEGEGSSRADIAAPVASQPGCSAAQSLDGGEG